MADENKQAEMPKGADIGKEVVPGEKLTLCKISGARAAALCMQMKKTRKPSDCRGCFLNGG